MHPDQEPVTKAERLSALVDDATDRFETRRLVDELLRSEEDRRQWARYHLIGDSLRGGLRQIAPEDFSARVRAAVERETPPAVQRPAAATWLKPVAGVGIAAAVAMVTLVGLQSIGTDPAPGGLAPLAVDVAPVPQAEPDSGLAATPDPRFLRYLENHAELATPGSSSFARVRNSVDGD
jgi:sigma-E factor negative regulatory protein RseA